MDRYTSALERAFELAKSGRCRNITELRMALRSEGFSDEQVQGKSLNTQLRTLIEQAKQGQDD
jgi:hypothetical protein